MSLSEALKIEASRKHGPRCTLCILISGLPEGDAKALQAALSDGGVTSSAIARALASEGHDIRPETVRRHRARECAGS